MKKSRYFTIILIVLFSTQLFAQLHIKSTPPSFKYNLSKNIPAVKMPAINVEKLLNEDKAEQGKDVPFRFGKEIKVDYDLNNSGKWEVLPNGDRVWRLKIISEGAITINLIYDWFWLPEGAEFFVYNEDHSKVLGAYTSRNNKETGEFATMPVPGEATILEYFEPKNVTENGIISLKYVIHGYKDIFGYLDDAINDFNGSGSCNNNVICPEGDEWRNEIRSVAMILLGSGTRLCSGSLVNNVRQDLTQYFLTANHCLIGSVGSWIFMFNYESPTCENPTVEPSTDYTVQGAELMANNGDSDFALLKITEQIPDSFYVHFAGWSAEDVPSTQSVGIHHPDGDVKKISFDFDPNSSSDYDPSPYLPDSHWEITNWDDGTTEPGSSGSPLFDQNHHIVGQLHGGWASCESITQDYYGKFAMSWDRGTTPSTRLKDWLDPDNTGIKVLDGWDPSLGDPDSIPPTSITDLSVIDSTSNSLTLQWTAPYDTSFGGVKKYDIRMSTSAINDTSDFNAATQVSFVGLPADSGQTEMLVVTGLNFNTNYYFAIRSSDFWGNVSEMSNVAVGQTYDAPLMDVSTTQIQQILEEPQSATDSILITNVSTNMSTLEFNVELANNTFPDGAVKIAYNTKLVDTERAKDDFTHKKGRETRNFGGNLSGNGGPDLYGYKWIDSNDPNGPTYVWNDISSTGTEATSWNATGTFGPKDEGFVGPIPFGFNFKFYGNTYPEFYISSNGMIMFNVPGQNSFVNTSIPTVGYPDGFIAPFWDDLDGETNGKVYYEQIGNKMVVQFDNWSKFGDSGSLTFQIVMYNTGKIEYYYNDITVTASSATVGIESPDGTDGLEIAYNSVYVENNLAVRISASPDWLTTNYPSGLLFPNQSAQINLVFTTEGLIGGEYTMDVIITSNDPEHPEVVVPVTMSLTSEVPVELTSFDASVSGKSIELKWSTATETNNKGFEIERDNGDGWGKIAFVEGNGTTTKIHNYSFIDVPANITKGVIRYRLKQIDYDGTENYSSVVEVKLIPKEIVLNQNYPNPFNPSTNIKYELPSNSMVKLSVMDVLGREVAVLENSQKEAGYHTVTWNANSFASGIYFLRLSVQSLETGSTKILTKKMLLTK